MRLERGTLLLAGVVLAAGCGDVPTGGDLSTAPGPIFSVGSGPPMEAVMSVGAEDVGNPNKPPTHPSAHARDRMRPGTVVISRGGTVTFDVGAIHQVAIYGDGIGPDDIEVGPGTLEDSPIPGPFPPDFIIDDPAERIYLGPAISFSGHTTSFTFDEPGRYLVICTVTPHFVANDMYGWVIVK